LTLRDLLAKCRAAIRKCEQLELEREEWRGKAERYLHEWRLRDDDVEDARIAADEAHAAKEMWRARALEVEGRLPVSSMPTDMAPECLDDAIPSAGYREAVA